ncbi:polysaccharide deacetylase family protein [Legionella jordanis]|uniref:Polysaccharide deacetylase n=1 Tax=Legionella jordanis TaxID=456 RepID=A0A0W0V9E4_9GAMM|nr:polysaccharide deacetylase family protein [Legionella jordanis]KTD16755.1 polysaccharide deacetylase [Legionella jordanis]RMX03717.1 polysaccharide deacetylase [Legionella jordanis]RMX22221.1 polysaccharide deacetylase [Legionella jordanis]VEH11777.1 polysaccharide deacetylase [Legionella jordanis]HAT8712913.1 polysaccharide deacetylase family protein [Legionella jordanis]
MRHLIFITLFLASSLCLSQTKEIAITIDDLPLVAAKMNTPGNKQRATERFGKIIQALSEYNVPATGFVIGGAIAPGQMEFLEEFRKAGFRLGNHTYSHYNLNQMSADKYIADIDRADKKLANVLTEPKYFRYPYLAEGNKDKKQKVLDYLHDHHYVVAPVTVDSLDFRFNERLYKVPYRQREQYIQRVKGEYLAFIWKQTLRAEQRAKGKPVKQILLIHANILNSYLLGDILKMYKDKGYQFISLDEALKNPAPAITFPPPTNTNKTEQQNNDDLLSIFWD